MNTDHQMLHLRIEASRDKIVICVFAYILSPPFIITY